MEDSEEAQVEWEDVQPQLDKWERAIEQLEQFLANIKRDWEYLKKHIIGHVVNSPPLVLGNGKGGFTQDLAIIEVDTVTYLVLVQLTQHTVASFWL